MKVEMYDYTKKSYFALGNFAKLVFWSIVSFKNWKLNSEFVSVSEIYHVIQDLGFWFQCRKCAPILSTHIMYYPHPKKTVLGSDRAGRTSILIESTYPMCPINVLKPLFHFDWHSPKRLQLLMVIECNWLGIGTKRSTR